MNESRKQYRNSLRVLALFVVTCFSALVVVTSVQSETVSRTTDSQVMDIRPPAEGSPVLLMDTNDCWSGEAPADMQGVVPGHVVVKVGSGDPRYAGSRMVGKALEQIFEGKDHNLTVYGFCR